MMESAEKDMKTAIINLFYILRDVNKNKHIEKYGRYKKELNWNSRYENTISEMENTILDGIDSRLDIAEEKTTSELESI